MSDFVEWLQTVGKKLLTNPAESLEFQRSPLTSTTVQKQYENFLRKHYMVDTGDYIGMLAVQESYKLPSSRELFLDNQTSYNEALSTDRIAVYNRGNFVFKTMYIAIHGTKLTSISDIIQDTKLVLGLVKDSATTSFYVNQILNIVKASGLPRDNIYVCGHSLSSYYALLSSYITNTNCRTFNGVNELISLSNYPEIINVNGQLYPLTGMNIYSNTKSYRMFGDPISLLNKWTVANTITIRVDNMTISPLTAHSMDYMVEVCIPEIPLDKRDFTRRRQFNRLPIRNEMRTEGKEFEQLREDADNTVFDRLKDRLIPESPFI